jgi:hypothetical protein
MNTWKLALAGVLLAAAPAAAQRTISPGMTEAQVRSVLGEPATSRNMSGWTYLYYHNGCPIRCGSDDVVFLEDGKVVAAVFRTGARRFTGAAADDAIDAAGGNEGSAEARQGAGAQAAEPAVVGGIRIGNVPSREPASTVIVRDEDDGPAPAPARPLRRTGAREAATDSMHTDPPVRGEAQRQARERAVTPNVIPSQPNPSAQNSSGETERQRRERAITPTVIQPQAPRDTTRTP